MSAIHSTLAGSGISSFLDSLRSDLLAVVDVKAAYYRGELWTDAARTTVATTAGQIIRAGRCPYTGKYWAIASPGWPLRFDGISQWWLDSTDKNCVLTFGEALPQPWTLGCTFMEVDSDAYNQLLTNPLNSASVSWDNTDHVYIYGATGAIDPVADSGRIEGLARTRIDRAASGAATIRLDGTSIKYTVAATNAAFTAPLVGSNGNASPAYWDTRHCVIAPIKKALSTDEITGLNTFLASRKPTPAYWITFYDPGSPAAQFQETLQLWETYDGQSFRYVAPITFDVSGNGPSPYTGSSRTPRDPGSALVGDDLYVAVNPWSHGEGTTFVIGKGTRAGMVSGSLTLTEHAEVDCSEITGVNYVWAPELHYVAPYLYAVVTLRVSSGNPTPYLTKAVAPFTDFDALTEITGSAIPDGAYDMKIQPDPYLGGYRAFFSTYLVSGLPADGNRRIGTAWCATIDGSYDSGRIFTVGETGDYTNSAYHADGPFGVAWSHGGEVGWLLILEYHNAQHGQPMWIPAATIDSPGSVTTLTRSLVGSSDQNAFRNGTLLR